MKLFSLLLLFSGMFAVAQIPKTLSFQGYLTNTAGEPITNNALTVSFSLYDAVTEGKKVWGPEEIGIEVDRGIFNTILGEGVSTPINLAFDQMYFLEIIIDPNGTPETLGRIQLTSSAYSISSANAANITVNQVSVANGGTGASTATQGRANLGLTIGSDVQAFDADLSTFAGISPTTDVQTLLGSANNTEIQSNIGLGSIGTQDSDNINITGGAIYGITDLAVADGGTGAGSATAARDSLNVEIGKDVQAYDSDLDDLADGTLSNSLLESTVVVDSVSTINGLKVGKSLQVVDSANIDGYTRLGTIAESAPAIKMKKLTSTTIDNANGGSVSKAHGITDHTKILSVSVFVLNSTNLLIPSVFTGISSNNEFYFFIDDTNVFVITNSNSSQLQNRPITIFIQYEQ